MGYTTAIWRIPARINILLFLAQARLSNIFTKAHATIRLEIKLVQIWDCLSLVRLWSPFHLFHLFTSNIHLVVICVHFDQAAFVSISDQVVLENPGRKHSIRGAQYLFYPSSETFWTFLSIRCILSEKYKLNCPIVACEALRRLSDSCVGETICPLLLCFTNTGGSSKSKAFDKSVDNTFIQRLVDWCWHADALCWRPKQARAW